MFRLAIAALYIMAASLGAGLVVAASWWLEPAPLEVHTAVSDVDRAARGDVVTITYTATKDPILAPQCEAHSSILIQDAAGQVWEEPATANFNPGQAAGEFKTVVRKVVIPSEVVDGYVTIYERVTYRCNPIRTHVVFAPPVTVWVQ